MTRKSRVFTLVLVMLIVVSLVPGVASAGYNAPMVIDSQVLITEPVPPSPQPIGIAVQATSWLGTTYRYVLTVINLSPWPMTSLRVLDRYLSAMADQGEVDHEWFPRRLESGQVATYLLEFPKGAFPGGCHQIEISLADGLSTILMDCSAPNATTLWNVPLTKDMESYLAKPALTRADPAGRSKLGIHVTRNSSPQIMDFMRKASPAVVVAVGDLGWLADVKAASPKTITVGRLQEGDQTIGGDAVKRAQDFVAANAATYLANPGVDYWLGWNEPTISNPQQMEWFGIFEAERIAQMARLGLRVAVGNFATGTPEADAFKAFLPALSVAKKFGGILALHEYSAPTLRDGVGAGIRDLDANDSQGALTLRYRYWYDYYLRPNDLVLPLIVTEAGIDGGVLKDNKANAQGWRDFARVSSGASLAEASSDYRSQLSWYDDELRRDPYVLGFAVFNAGDSDRWKSFDVTDILPQLADLVGSKH
jgi:hypothetical protein